MNTIIKAIQKTNLGTQPSTYVYTNYQEPCSECQQVIPHTINEHFEYAEATCPHCKAESFIQFGEAEQEILADILS